MAGRAKKQHRGQLLALAIQNSGRNRDDIAKRAGYSRSSLYKHMKIPLLPFHILEDYGRVLYVDFAEQIPEMPHYLLEEPEEAYNSDEKGEENLRRGMEYWKKRYYKLLERHNTLLEKLNRDLLGG